MSAGLIQYFDEFKRWQFAEGAQLDDGSVKVALFTSALTPSASAHSIFSDIAANELVHVSYTPGGVSLVSPVVSQTAGVGQMSSSGVVIPFVATSASVKWAVFYADATIGGLPKPLIAYVDLRQEGGDMVILPGYNFILNTPAAGWFGWN